MLGLLSNFHWHPTGIRRIASAMAQAPSHKQTPPPNHAGRWYLAFLGLSLVLVGGVFVWLLGRSYLRAREMRGWPEVACVILSSELEEKRHDENSPLEFRQELSFGYEWQGLPRTGTHLTLRSNPWSSKRELMEARIREYPVGKSTTCRVNPTNPDFAVLKTDSLAPGYSIWFPGLFVVGGLGIIVRAAVGPKR